MSRRRIGGLLFGLLFGIATFVASAEDIALTLTADATFAEALAVYNAAKGTSFVDSDGGVSLGANNVTVSGSHVLTFSKALASWTGDLTIKSGATVYAVSDNTSYSSVLGAPVTGTTTNGQVFVESGASLQVRTNADDNNSKLGRPVHIVGSGVGGKGALQLSSTTNIRAMYPKCIHLDGDARLCRLGNDSKLSGGTVMTSTTTLFLNGHVLTLAKGDANMILIFESPAILVPGEAGGFVAADGCQFGMRSFPGLEGGSNNFFRVQDPAKMSVEQGFPNVPWTLDYMTTSDFSATPNKAYPLDESGTARCWVGPVNLARDFRFKDADANSRSHQLGFRGKVSGLGGISATATQKGVQKRFHLVSGENDFTGGVAVTNMELYLGSPTAIPSGAGKGALSLCDATVTMSYPRMSDTGDFVLPPTTLSGVSSISNAIPPCGRFEKLTVTDADDVRIDAILNGGELDVGSATVRLPTDANRTSWYAGSVKQANVYPNAADDFTNATYATASAPRTDTIAKTLAIFYEDVGDASAQPWQSHYYQNWTSYSGSIVNNTGKPKTLYCVCTLNAAVGINFRDTYIATGQYSRQDGTKPYTQVSPKRFTLTVQPGVNAIAFRIYDRFGTGTFLHGNVCTNGLTNWDSRHGLMWSETDGATDLSQFRDFSDFGEGIAISLDGKAAGKCSHVLDRVSGIGTIDLGGGTLEVDSFGSDCPTFVNGTVTLTSAITDDRSSVDLSCVSSASIDVPQGAATRRSAVSGLYAGKSDEIKHFQNLFTCTAYNYPGTDMTDAEFACNHTLTNLPDALSPTVYYRSIEDWWDNATAYRFLTWDGWIWNNSGETKTYRLVSTLNAQQRLSIGGKFAWDGVTSGVASRVQPWYEGTNVVWSPYTATITLRPGATRFTAKVFDQFGACYRSNPAANLLRGNVRTNALENWDDMHGLVRSENLQATALGEFESFADAGDGLLFTKELPAGAFPSIIAAGTAVDLCGHDNATSVFTGYATFANGRMTVLDVWNLSFAQLENPAAVVENVAFAAGCKLVIDDATAEEILANMPASGYLIGRNCSGAPKYVNARGLRVFERDGMLYLGRLGLVFVVR